MLTADRFGFTQSLFAALNEYHREAAMRHLRHGVEPAQAWTSVQFGQEGASATELESFEIANALRLPEDLRTLAQIVHDPDRAMFPWLADPQCLTKSKAWIQRGIEFDIHHGSSWLERWGEPPSDKDERIRIFRADFISWPTLIPVSSRFHRIQPNETGNPVYSIMQSDIIYYGADLASWLAAEFLGGDPVPEEKAGTLPMDSAWDNYAQNQNVRRDIDGRSNEIWSRITALMKSTDKFTPDS